MQFLVKFQKALAFDKLKWYNKCNVMIIVERLEQSGLLCLYGHFFILEVMLMAKKSSGSRGGNTVALVYDLVKPITDELGLILWDVVFEKEGAYWYLRVFIDRDDDMPSMDDCENVTRPLSKILDEKDPIEQSYILEVGSPGLGRELKKKEHFERYLECPVRIRFIRENEKGEKEIIAALKSYDKDSVTVMADGEESIIKLSDTAFVKLYDDEDVFDEDFEE